MSQASDNRPFKIDKPTHLESLSADQTVAAILRLAMEVSVLRDRLKTQEKLLIENNILTSQSVEQFVPDAEDASERGQSRMQLIERLINDLSS